MLLALTNLFGATGGIPAFNRLLCHAAFTYTHAQGRELEVLALMDDLGQARDAQVLPAGRYRSFGGDRRRFALAVLAGLAPRGAARRGLCLGHVNLAPLGLAALGTGFGVVAHGTEVWTPLPLLRRQALRRARAVACVSDDTARKVREVQGVAAGRTVRVINALDPWSWPSRGLTEPASGPRPPGGLRLVSVTRLEPTEPKGVDLVLEALVGLPPDTTYTVIGDGPARPGLEARAAALGLGQRVRFLGRVDDETRTATLAACDVFVLPSAGEGFGIVYLEAMAHGKPCLAAAVGGAPEVVRDGETGVVVTPGSAAAVREGLSRLLGAGPEDQAAAAKRAALGAAGHARLLANYTYRHFQSAATPFFTRLVS